MSRSASTPSPDPCLVHSRRTRFRGGTLIVDDVHDLAPEPATVQGAGFQPNRLDTLRSRTSAAYRGLYLLVQRDGARDFFWKTKMVELDRDEEKIDIHHIFPRKWCDEQRVPRKVANAIVNKTAISYKANRMIGGKAPSAYLGQLQKNPQAQLADGAMDEILRSHLVEPALLRADNFDGFYAARKAALLGIITRSMGKPLAEIGDAVADDTDDDEGDETDSEA